MGASAFDSFTAGLDLGTQGVRCVVLDGRGETRGHAEIRLGEHAFSPRVWWPATLRALAAATSRIDRRRIRGLAVTSTSGTLVLLDGRERVLGDALPYHEAPAVSEAARLAVAHGVAVSPTAAAARLLRLRERSPERFERIRRVVHAADVLVWRLTGRWATDWSHALKTGFDPDTLRWSPLLDSIGLPPGALPRVVLPPGSEIGRVGRAAIEGFGLDPDARVFAGMTDGCTSQIAAGAVFPGEWCTTIGTTLVVKGVTTRRLDDRRRGLYSHRHPDGFWMPGGASNVGGGCLETDFAGRDLAALDRLAAGIVPTHLVVYPLRLAGERFPFASPDAKGLSVGTATGEAEHFAALLEGVAYVERLAYETLGRLGAAIVGPIASAGGGARSALWTQIRSDVLGRPVRRVGSAQAAAGAAILAAAGLARRPLAGCAREMVARDGEVEPRAALVPAYRERYEVFVASLARRGYLDGLDDDPPQRAPEADADAAGD